MNALTLIPDIVISVNKTIKFHRIKFTFGYSLWILDFVPLEITKLDDDRQNYFFLYMLKHFVHKNIIPHFVCVYRI